MPSDRPSDSSRSSPTGCSAATTSTTRGVHRPESNGVGVDRDRDDRRVPARAFLLFALATAAALAVGRVAMFAGFSPWDDEGYVLLTLKMYVGGRRLYDELYTQYGPAFYELLAPLFTILGVSFDHSVARWITLGTWLATSVLCGVGAFRITGRTLLGLCVQLLVFRALAVLCNEPLHPAALLSLLLGLLVGLIAPARRLGRAAAAFAGAALAIMLMVKINVGVF